MHDSNRPKMRKQNAESPGRRALKSTIHSSKALYALMAAGDDGLHNHQRLPEVTRKLFN